MIVVGIVPARGGSKGVPRKNLAQVAGEPLVVHTIRAALAAETLNRVVVSTDDDDIAAISRAAGAEVVMRPPALAADESRTEDALLHAVDALGPPEPDYVVTLEPTSPLRTPALIDTCVRLALDRGADAVVTVAETREVMGRVEGGCFVPLEPGLPRRRQERSALYRELSAVYVTRTSHLRAAGSVLAASPYAVVVPEEQAIDINTTLDLFLADAVMRGGESR
jgi:CMP-N,N'-diacetyllegionaminic acid synthase